MILNSLGYKTQMMRLGLTKTRRLRRRLKSLRGKRMLDLRQWLTIITLPKSISMILMIYLALIWIRRILKKYHQIVISTKKVMKTADLIRKGNSKPKRISQGIMNLKIIN